MLTVADLKLTIDQLPRGNRLIVLPLVQASAGTLIDMEPNREKPEQGLVLKVGPGGVGPESGRQIPVVSVVGELVCYGKYAGQKWEIPGPKGRPLTVFIMSDSEIMLAQPADTLDLVMHDDDPSRIHQRGLICEHCPRVDGEQGLERLRSIGRGEDPDAAVVDVDAAIQAERDRVDTVVLTD